MKPIVFTLLVILSLMFLTCNPITDIEDLSIFFFSFQTKENPQLSLSVTGLINDDSITIYIPDTTDFKNLRPRIVHNGTKISPASFEAQDFSQVMSYKIEDEKGNLKEYKVTTIYGSPPPAEEATPEVTPSPPNEPTETPDASPSISPFSGLILLGNDRNAYFFPTMDFSGEYFTSQIHPLKEQNDIIHHDDMVIAVGNSGSISYTYINQAIVDDELQISWTNTSCSDKNFRSVTYGNQGYVAVGEDGILARSSDGINWQSISSGTSSTLYEVKYIDNHYIAVGIQGSIVYSSDSTTWNQKSIGNMQLYAVSGNDSKYLAVGNNGAVYSANEPFLSWSEEDSPAGGGDHLFCITYGNNQFITLGQNGFGMVCPSNDNDWDMENTGINSSIILRDVININNNFIAIGSQGAIYTCCDIDLDWTGGLLPGLPDFSNLTYAP